MPTRNVVLTDHQSALIDRLVASGRYQNASEVLRAGLRHVEAEEEAFLRLKARLEDGLADYERGDFAEGDGLDILRAMAARVGQTAAE